MRRRTGRGRWIAAAFAGALLLGAAGSAWLSWEMGWLKVGGSWFGNEPAPQQVADAADPVPVIAPDSAAKLANLESRLSQIDAQASAASGQASRAEGLLIAFATRRAIERGQALGYLENQLNLRFGQVQPRAVKQVVDAAATPVTIDQLSEQLLALEPQLVSSGPQEGTWDWIARETSELFIIRHADSPSPAPARRLDRARLYLAGGRVDAAVDEVRRMPGAAAAKDWLARAEIYVRTQHALDILETAALLQPQPQPLPVAEPSPAPAPAPAPTN
jgi:hypothetical protein